MKHLGWLAALGLLLALGSSRAVPAQALPQQVVPGEFVIKFTANSQPQAQAASVAALGGHIVDRIPELGLVAARFDAVRSGTRTAADVLSTLEQNPIIAFAEPNKLVTIADDQLPVAPDAPQPAATRTLYLPLVVGNHSFTPNDPYLSSQYAWNLIRAYQGWGVSQGGADVIVAVVDTGIQLDHPDLRAKLAPGYDFVQDDSDPNDGEGHGTHVAGTVGASTNNGIGVAGTCPACRVMPVRVLDNNGSGSNFDVANGIRYAVDHGARVINLSIEGEYSEAMETAVNYAWNKGATLVCAAGNGNTSDIGYAYPGAYENCLAVAATTGSDQRAGFSNYGAWVDLAAPGVNIYSTTIGSSYRLLSGTSMAAPHVAGAAGILAAQGLTNSQIRARLQATADKIEGTGTYWSNGRLNMQRAIDN